MDEASGSKKSPPVDSSGDSNPERLSKKEIACKNWLEFQHCPYGIDCNFMHTYDTATLSSVSAQLDIITSQMCKLYKLSYATSARVEQLEKMIHGGPLIPIKIGHPAYDVKRTIRDRSKSRDRVKQRASEYVKRQVDKAQDSKK